MEDLLQQAFLKFLQYSPWRNRWRELPDSLTLSAYFATTLRNLLYDYVRSFKRLEPADFDVDSLESKNDFQLELSEDIQTWFDSLNDIDKQLVLGRLQGKTLGASTAELGLSYSDGGVRLHRLKKKLEKHRRKV